jgi:hypothetical protein
MLQNYMNKIELNPSIFKHIEAIKTNSENFFNAFPNLLLAAEEIHDIFDQLFVEQFQQKNNALWEASVHKMIFGAHSSWLQGIILTAAGLNETGLISIRRGIEYVCYSSKIKQSDEKNIIWLDRGMDDEKDRLFSSKFSIPSKYFTDKYKNLKALLVWHDYASLFGAHGNFTSLISKWDSESEGSMKMFFHDNPQRTPLSTGVAVRIGSFMITAFFETFKGNIKDEQAFQEKIEIMNEILNKARVEVINYESKGKVTFEDLLAVYSREDPAIEEMYLKLKEKYCK